MSQYDDDDPGMDSPCFRYNRGSEEDAIGWNPKPLAEFMQRICYTAAIEPACDSPIEAILGAAILEKFERDKIKLVLCRNEEIGRHHDNIVLVPQFRWSIYRSDWALILPGNLSLLIECDGRDFHSLEDQREHDRRKDAAAFKLGYRTMRFWGSEIHNNADQCADRIFKAIYP